MLKKHLALLLVLALIQGASAIKPGEKLIDVDGLINATYPCIASGNSIYISADAPVGQSNCTFYYAKWVNEGSTGGGGGGKDTGPPDFTNAWNPNLARPIPLITPITITNPPGQDNQTRVIVAQPLQVNLDGNKPTEKEYVYVNKEIPGATITIEKPNPYSFWLILLAGISFMGFLIICTMYLILRRSHQELQDEHERLARR